MNNWIINGLRLNYPRPYQAVDRYFTLHGQIPAGWIETEASGDYRIFINCIDINCKFFMGGSIDVDVPRFFVKFRKNLSFTARVCFDQISIGWVLSSKGLVTLKLSGHKDGQIAFIPIVVKLPGIDIDGLDKSLLEKHKNVGSEVTRLERESRLFDKEVTELFKYREDVTSLVNESKNGLNIDDPELIEGIGQKILACEDESLLKIQEKYREVLEWEPRFGGSVGRVNGLMFIVYSNDHGKHFHVIHKERCINARFSFPDIELISYKQSQNTIGRKEQLAIKEFFKDSKNFTKLKNEIEKQVQG